MLSDTSNPEQFMDNIKCIDWYPTLINFLRENSGRNGFTLSYLCRPTNMQVKSVHENFIDKYVDKASLFGQAFTTDAAEVHTYIVRFTSGNKVAEAKMFSHSAENSGCLDFMALKYHYKGAGVHAVNVLQDDKLLNNLFYSGDKKTHIWWEESERQVTNEFNTYDRLEKRSIHSNDIRLCI